MSESPEKNLSDAAPEGPAFLTTREVAALLRVRERKVYDMAAAGAIPCRKVTGKLLFPREEIENWLGAGDARAASGAASASPSIIVGSHDPLLVWALSASGCETPSLFGGSLDGLDRLAAGEAMAAALHLFDRDRSEWNIPALESAALEDRFVLIGFARRRQGLVYAPDAQALEGVRDLRGRKVMLRQRAAGGRLLLEALLTVAGVDSEEFEAIDEEARSENDAAEAIADGRAEAALGLEAMARRYGLGFTPLIEERFDLVIDRHAYFEPPLQRLFAFLRSETFRERASALGGYDVSDCGAVRWNGPTR